jgi:cell division cycle 20, cofactor of APC complex
MRLADATGVQLNKRVLAFHEAPPQPSSDKALETQRQIAGPLFSRPPAHSNSTNTFKARKIKAVAERVLDAPGIVDDYYLNLVDWSCENIVAVGLAESTYIWRADVGSVSHVTDAPESCYISSVKFSNDGAYLAVAFNTGSIELWDIEANKRLRTMHGRQAQVAVMSWNQHILSSGCQDGGIWHHDVRIAQHKAQELIGHNGEICGPQWRPDGELLASGGNDNVVNIWDGRVGDVVPGSRGGAKWTKRNHTAAVKVS